MSFTPGTLRRVSAEPRLIVLNKVIQQHYRLYHGFQPSAPLPFQIHNPELPGSRPKDTPTSVARQQVHPGRFGLQGMEEHHELPSQDSDMV